MLRPGGKQLKRRDLHVSQLTKRVKQTMICIITDQRY